MRVRIDDLRRDCLALLGESPGLSPVLEEGEESGVLLIEDELRARLLPLAAEATLETPLHWLDEIENCGNAIQWSEARTDGIIPLPSDYLRLYCLRLEGWRDHVYEPEPPDTLRAQLGARCPDWMACAENPLVVERTGPEGRCLMVKGVTSNPAKPEIFLYIPRPEIERDELRISSAAYPLLLEKLVSRVSS